MNKQKGMATLLAFGLIAAAFGVGIFFEKFTDKIDHPAEQVAEEVLEEYGIDVDFSEDKKKELEQKKAS